LVEADKERLSRLLDYWIEHNKEHGDEFREWAEKAGSFTGTAIRDHLLEAAQQMDKVNEFLLMALDRLEEDED
jgi:thymidylate kinase